VEAVYLMPVPTDPFLASRIPLNSKIYIAPFKSEDPTKPVEGFETYMAAALRKKGVQLIMIADRAQGEDDEKKFVRMVPAVALKN
jgi:hypothetical protein